MSTYEDTLTLYPVEAKALSTGDSVNLAQVQAAYTTISNKIPDIEIIPLAVQMIPEGMYVAIFEDSDSTTNELIITRYLKVVISPSIPSWQIIRRKRRKNDLEN